MTELRQIVGVTRLNLKNLPIRMGPSLVIVAGIVNDFMVISVRNLGYSKNAGEFVRRFFADIGSAGGHRAMAKAVVPMRAFYEKFGFQTVAEAPVLDTPNWFMRRPAISRT